MEQLPGFVSRHQQFIAHFIYFSQAVASASAQSSSPGGAEVGCSHVKHYTIFSLATGCQTLAIFKLMRLCLWLQTASQKKKKRRVLEWLLSKGFQEPDASSNHQAAQLVALPT